MANPLPERCPYEVLGVTRDSSWDEIRSAFLRLALKLHPDKVTGGAASIAAATLAFQELHDAYEFLSDPQDRADYNAGNYNANAGGYNANAGCSRIPSNTEAYKAWYATYYEPYFYDTGECKPFTFFNVNLRSYFADSAYSGFSDDFYKVFGDIFHKIHSQEGWFSNYTRPLLDNESAYIEYPAAPLIGNIDSPHSKVAEFYEYWLSFSTVLDFAWIVKFDVNKFPSFSSRVMEEENTIARNEAKMEYNNLVRALAGFAKEKDTRVIDMEAKKNLEAEKRREEEEARKVERQEEMRKMLERVLRCGEMEETEDGEELYCVVCNKSLKSEKQWRKHRKSEKHKDKVAGLKISLNIRDEPVYLEPRNNPFWALMDKC